MNNLKHILFASVFLASVSATAQETYQDTKLAVPQLTGTARYVGMGGAMEALGADISTISSNPAGIGLFRKSQVSISAGVIAQGDAQNSVSYGLTTIDINGKKSHPTFDQPGLLTVTTDGALAYAEANQYLYGQYQHGYIGTYDFNVSGSINNQVWLGLTVGLHDVHYNSNSYYAEDLVDGNAVDSYEQLKITGTGFDVKAGVIFRPVKDSPFRIGAYFNSPIFYDLTLHGDNDIRISGNNAPATYTEADGTQAPCYTIGRKGQSIDYDFRLNTPWKVGASLGHTIGNFLALGATYEYAWFSHMDNRVKNSGYYDYWTDSYYESSSSDEAMNADTRANLKGVSTLKLGAEWKPVDMLSIRLGYNYVSPMFKDGAYRDATIGSNGVYASTSTDYTNWKATNRFTCGVGFNYQNLTIDVAYQYSAQKGDFYPFMRYVNEKNPDLSNVAQSTQVKNNRHQLMMTVGYKF